MAKRKLVQDADELLIGGRKVRATYLYSMIFDKRLNKAMPAAFLESVTVYKARRTDAPRLARADTEKAILAWLDDGLSRRNNFK